MDPALLQESKVVVEYPVLDGYQHPPGLAGKRMLRDLEIMGMSQHELEMTWLTVIRDTIRARSALKDEGTKRTQVNVSVYSWLSYRQTKSFIYKDRSCKAHLRLRAIFQSFCDGAA